MRTLPPDSRADRRQLIAGLATFLATGTCLVAVGARMSIRYIFPHDGWLGIGHAFVVTLMLPLLGASAATWGVVAALSRLDFRRGVYRCVHCGRALRGIGEVCVCQLDDPDVRRMKTARERRRLRPKWRHERQHLGAAISIELALVPIALLSALAAEHFFPARRAYPLWLEVVIAHALLGGLLVVCLEVVFASLELIHRGRRFRVRAIILQRLLAVWPVAFSVVAAIVSGARLGG